MDHIKQEIQLQKLDFKCCPYCGSDDFKISDFGWRGVCNECYRAWDKIYLPRLEYFRLKYKAKDKDIS